MKNAFALLVIIAVPAVFSTSASASDAIRPYVSSGKSGHFNYSVYNSRWLRGEKNEAGTKLAAITGLSPDTQGDIVIPPSLDGFKIYGIDDNAFKSCKGIRSITIPKTVRFLKTAKA